MSLKLISDRLTAGLCTKFVLNTNYEMTRKRHTNQINKRVCLSRSQACKTRWQYSVRFIFLPQAFHI